MMRPYCLHTYRLEQIECFLLLVRHHRYIQKPILYRTIIPAMGIGLVAGMAAFYFIRGAVLERIFGCLVIVLSARELHRLFRSKKVQSVLSRRQSTAYMTAAGFIHGIYASGGPLLIYAVGKLDLPKAVFRSTLGAVWLFFSIILTGFYLWSGKFTQESMKLILVLFPMIVAGIIIGEWLHRHIDEYRFKIFVFAVLLLAGGSIIMV